MANLLIGSSNLNRHYKVTDFPNIRQYKMLKCTQMTGYDAYMGGLVADNKNVLISVVENFIVDAVGAATAQPEAAIDACIKDFLTTTLDAALKFPNSKFGIVMPLQRPAVKWYNDRVGPITKFIGEGVKAMISERSVNNVSIINTISVASQQFEQDQIHLTAPSASVFLEVILDAAEKFFDAPLVDLTEAGASTDSLEDRLARLESLFRHQLDKGISDNLMFARTREELDAASNCAKEDRIVINGLSSPTPLPTDPRQRIEALKGIVAGVFEKIIPGFTGRIVYLSQGKQPLLAQQLIEVKLDKAENAIAVRKAFADRRKKKELAADLDSIFLSNCVNLATRIRVDILKAIARRLTNDKDLAYVAGFTSRPMMHIRMAGAPSANTRPLRSFTFIDSVSRFGRQLSKEDLETAYGRAGRSFNGQLQQNFVVLNERDQDLLQSVTQPKSGPSGTSVTRSGYTGSGARGGSSARGKGTKRAGDEIDPSNSKK
jgi:hypothetical protein